MAAKKTIRWFNLVAALRGATDGLATAEVHRRLQEMPAVDPVDLRTIQRDLVELADSGIVALDREERDGRDVWRLDRRFLGINEDRTITSTIALTLKMAIEHASILLPLEAQAFLLGQSDRIEKALQREGAGGRIPWADKVRVVPAGFQAQRPDVEPAVVETVYRCIAVERRMSARLPMLGRTGSTRVEISPLGLLYRQPSLLVVGWVHERKNIEAIPLEQIHAAEALETPIERPADFNLDDFLWQGRFDGECQGPMRVRLRCSRRLADTWRHTPLGRDQVISGPKDAPEIEATCDDNELFLGYLFGLGTAVTVLSPQSLVDRISRLAYSLVMHYSGTSDDDIVIELSDSGGQFDAESDGSDASADACPT